jgi:CheY-like chemotaxis protein
LVAGSNPARGAIPFKRGTGRSGSERPVGGGPNRQKQSRLIDSIDAQSAPCTQGIDRELCHVVVVAAFARPIRSSTYFFVRQATPTMSSSTLQGARVSVTTKQIRIIHIVEDDEAIRDSTRLLLEAVGFQVQVFRSPNDYLASDFVGVADCMLFDVHMPAMTGLELLELLRSRGIKTPVIIMTGNGVHLKSRLIRGSNCSVLFKPFEESELLSKIADACSPKNDLTH